MLNLDIEDIRKAIRVGRFTNEAAVSQGIVLRILHALSWPTYDPQIVSPEYSVEGRRVDFAPVVNELRGVLQNEEGQKASDSPLGLIIANLARMNNIYRKPITAMTLDSADAAKEVFDLAAISISLLEKDFLKRSAT